MYNESSILSVVPVGCVDVSSELVQSLALHKYLVEHAMIGRLTGGKTTRHVHEGSGEQRPAEGGRQGEGCGQGQSTGRGHAVGRERRAETHRGVWCFFFFCDLLIFFGGGGGGNRREPAGISFFYGR